MRLARLLARHAGPQASRWVAGTVAGGALTAVVVGLFIEASAREIGLGSWVRGLVFLVVLGLMYGARRWSSRVLIGHFEGVSAELRGLVVARLQAAPLATLEARRADVARLTGDLAFVSTTLEGWVSGLQHLAFVAGATVMVAFISPRALIWWVFTLGLMTAWIWPRLREVDAVSRRLGAASGHLGDRVGQLVDGLAQLKLDAALAGRVLGDVDAAVAGVGQAQAEAETASRRAFVGAIGILFVVGLGVAAFAPSNGPGLPPSESYGLVAYFQIAWAPIFAVVTSVPQMVRAEAAASGVLDLLDRIDAEPSVGVRQPPPFEAVELRGATFSYPARGGVAAGIGPIDLRLRRGEITFVVGGNGSGKTTLAKVLLGLYPLAGGERLIDGRRVAAGDVQRWRGLFTAVLDGQHLFDRLYGLEHVAPEAVDGWLERMALTEAVGWSEGRFGGLALSAGQRMRLAMVVGLLEDRPVCVFDEWAANQDPGRTRWYYEVFLPALAAEGRAVLAVSHDDRYFDRADRLVVLDRGRVVERRG